MYSILENMSCSTNIVLDHTIKKYLAQYKLNYMKTITSSKEFVYVSLKKY